MPGPATTGVLIYASNPESLSIFYRLVLGGREVHADNQHRVVQSADAQLIIEALPPQIASSIVIEVPPTPRQEQAIKPFFTVESLSAAERLAEECGGRVCGPVWSAPGLRVRNVCDPEGNIIHLREKIEMMA